MQGVGPRKWTIDDVRYLCIAAALIVLRMPALIVDAVLIGNPTAYQSEFIAGINWISVRMYTFFEVFNMHYITAKRELLF